MRDLRYRFDRLVHSHRLAGAAALMGIACLCPLPVAAQSPGQVTTTANYECPANSHCTVSCQVDGDKIFQTGAPKTVSITMLAPNNYLVELLEQNGELHYDYLSGTKVVCTFDGVTKKRG